MAIRERLREQVSEDARERAEMAKHIGAIVEGATMRAHDRFFNKR